MRCSLLVLVLLFGFLGVLAPGACAQTYRLTSWEGRPLRVSVSYQLWSKHLAVSCAGDTLFLQDYQGDATVRVLQHRFLQITYDTRCGSGCWTQYTVLLAIRQHRFEVPLCVLSANEWQDFSPTFPRARRYAVALTMTKGAAKAYTLQARVHDAYTEAGNTHAVDRRVTLRFDSARHVFYSARELVARGLFVSGWQRAPGDWSALPFLQPDVTPRNFPAGPLYVVGTFPVVRLAGAFYYFIQGRWYEGLNSQETSVSPPAEFMTDAVQYVPKQVRARP
jgi:hypothetical protein